MHELLRLKYVRSAEEQLTVKKIDELFAANFHIASKLGYRKTMRSSQKLQLLIEHVANGGHQLESFNTATNNE